MRSHHSDGDLTVVGSISRIHGPGPHVEENVATTAGLQVWFESTPWCGPPRPEADGCDGRFRGHDQLLDRGQRSVGRPASAGGPEFATTPAGGGVNCAVGRHSTSCIRCITRAHHGSGHLLPALGHSEPRGVVVDRRARPQRAIHRTDAPRSWVRRQTYQSPSPPRLRKHPENIPEDRSGKHIG